MPVIRCTYLHLLHFHVYLIVFVFHCLLLDKFEIINLVTLYARVGLLFTVNSPVSTKRETMGVLVSFHNMCGKSNVTM